MRNATIVAIAAILSACGSTFYTYEGVKYNSVGDFRSAVDGTNSRILSGIPVLPTPVSNKTLVFVTPAVEVLIAETRARFVRLNGSEPNRANAEVMENVTIANSKGAKVFGEAIARQQIYAHVQLLDSSTMAPTVTATPGADAIYYSEPSQGSGQWYFVSATRGAQIFAYDRSQPGAVGKVNGFLAAVRQLAAQP